MTPMQTQTGLYVVRGLRVPSSLAFVWDDERDLAAALQCGPGIAIKIATRNGRHFGTRTFTTLAECEQAIAAFPLITPRDTAK